MPSGQSSRWPLSIPTENSFLSFAMEHAPNAMEFSPFALEFLPITMVSSFFASEPVPIATE